MAGSLGTFPRGDRLWISRPSHISSDSSTLSIPMKICTQSRLTCRLRSGYPCAACCLLPLHMQLLGTRSSTHVNNITAIGVSFRHTWCHLANESPTQHLTRRQMTCFRPSVYLLSSNRFLSGFHCLEAYSSSLYAEEQKINHNVSNFERL
jgi:hypothetical protein